MLVSACALLLLAALATYVGVRHEEFIASIVAFRRTGTLRHTVLGAWIAHLFLCPAWYAQQVPGTTYNPITCDRVLGSTLPLIALIAAYQLWIWTFTTIAAFLCFQYFVTHHPSPWVRTLIREMQPSLYYKECELHVEGDKTPKDVIGKEKSLLAFHPHGVLAGGMSWNGVHHPAMLEVPVRYIVASGLYNMPVFGLLLRSRLDPDCTTNLIISCKETAHVRSHCCVYLCRKLGNFGTASKSEFTRL